MWYDYEWIQQAVEKWHRVPAGKRTGNRKFQVIKKAASAYLTAGKPQRENATKRDAEKLAREWVRENYLQMNDRMPLG